MADTKGVGPEGPIQPTGSTKKRLPDQQAFKEKLEKAGETDPEQKKKRRQQEEEVEELSDKMKDAAKAAKAKDLIAPFEVGKKLAAKADLESGSPKAPTEAGITPPPTDEIDTETGFWDEDELSILEEPKTAEEMKGPALPKAPGHGKGAPSLPKGGKLGEIEAQPLSIEEAKRKKEEKDLAASGLQKGAEQMIAPPPAPVSGIAPPPPPAEVTPYSQLSPAVMALFEKIAGVMTVMTQSGVTETTVSLTSDQFINSTFYGTEIVIREYSTAPKQFNVEVRGNAEAVAQFQANIPYIESSFRTGKYNFGIHRLETSVKRIEDEPVSRDKEDEDEQ